MQYITNSAPTPILEGIEITRERSSDHFTPDVDYHTVCTDDFGEQTTGIDGACVGPTDNRGALNPLSCSVGPFPRL